MTSKQSSLAVGNPGNFDLLRRILILSLVFVLVVALGGVFGQVLIRKGKLTPETPEETGKLGKLVGVHFENGAVYLGTLVFEDEKTLLLRDIYTPLGFFPSQEGGPLVFQVARLNESNPSAPKEQVIQKEKIMFSSEINNQKVLEAIDSYMNRVRIGEATPSAK